MGNREAHVAERRMTYTWQWKKERHAWHEEERGTRGSGNEARHVAVGRRTRPTHQHRRRWAPGWQYPRRHWRSRPRPGRSPARRRTARTAPAPARPTPAASLPPPRRATALLYSRRPLLPGPAAAGPPALRTLPRAARRAPVTGIFPRPFSL